MSIIIGALTGEYAYAEVTDQHPDDTADKEMQTALRSLMDMHAGTFFMHESTDPDRPQDYTRPWFAMANSMFGELFLKTYHTNPEVLGNL